MATKKTGGGKAKAAPLEPKVADKLLDLLSTDNAFRRLFKKDPLAALVQAGYKSPKEPTATALPAPCLQVTRIASKAQIIRARETLRDMLVTGLSQQPVQLNIASSTPRKLR